VAQEVECLFCKHDALSSSPSPIKKKEKKPDDPHVAVGVCTQPEGH
jgi:hypothetical protein